MVRRLGIAAIAALLCFTAGVSAADTAPFDLKGPDVEVRVTRAGKTLPISEVPRLQAGDRLRIHPILPDTQSVHYLLIVAFMRGVTNPPPETWFTRAETWKPPYKDEGIEVVVPEEAQQVVLFLAPETPGDLKTLRKNVQNRPGSFVRALQDLDLASLERARVDAYLAAMRQVPLTDEAAIKETSTTLARSLSLKINQDCFLRATSEQAQCLTQNTDQMVVDPGQSTSVVAQLTNGATSDLAAQISYTPTAGGGYYSAYVGAIFDVAKILDGLHTAQYQYIPALLSEEDDTIHTRLNNPPSFHNPKSVIVIALPPIETAHLPTLMPVNPKEAACLEKPRQVLGVVGDPALYSTAYGHDFVLHFQDKEGLPLDLPAVPDATLGGLKVDGSKVDSTRFGVTVTGTLKGMWGFEPYQGPNFTFDISHATQWKVPQTEQTALVIGRTDTLHLDDEEAACVSEVDVKSPSGAISKAEFKVSKPTQIEIRVPLKDDTKPGSLSVLVKEWGLPTTDEVTVNSYAEAGHLDSLTAYAGDPQVRLKGTRLDEVTGADINSVHFSPGKLTREGGSDELTLVAVNARAAEAFTVGQSSEAHFALKDGRTLELPVVVAPPRPRVTTISREIQVPPSDSSIHLTDQEEVPQDGGLTFSVKTVVPAAFPRTEQIEVATDDDSLKTTLSLADSSLVLEDATTMLATLDPRKSFGPSIFGPLHYRPVNGNGTPGDWQPLGVVVRLPIVSGVSCPRIIGRQHQEPQSAPDPAPMNAAPTPVSAGPVSAASQPSSATLQPSTNPLTQAAPTTPTLQPSTIPSAQDASQSTPIDVAQQSVCTLHGSNLFLIDSVASDAAFTHSFQVPEGFSGTTLNVPRPTAKTLYVKLRDDPDIVNTLQVP